MERPPSLLSFPASYVAEWVAKRARADVQQTLAEHGLGTADHGVLVALADFGALSQQQLAGSLGADKSHVVRLIDQLADRRLVTRAPDSTDRRRHRVELTPAGEELVRATVPLTAAVEAAHLETLTPAERRTLGALLRRVLEAQERDGDGPGR